MNASRLIYRTRQFWHALRTTSHLDYSLAIQYLTARQMELFQRMQLSEQAHSLKMLRCILEKGSTDRDLCVAVLLHDVGKIRLPLSPLERALIVLVRRFCKRCVQRWGRYSEEELKDLPRWRRAFVVAENHPEWGAAYAAAAGVSPLAVALIRRHQERVPDNPGSEDTHEDLLLRILQAVDDSS